LQRNIKLKRGRVLKRGGELFLIPSTPQRKKRGISNTPKKAWEKNLGEGEKKEGKGCKSNQKVLFELKATFKVI